MSTLRVALRNIADKNTPPYNREKTLSPTLTVIYLMGRWSKAGVKPIGPVS
jgi:hypothetical protein